MSKREITEKEYIEAVLKAASKFDWASHASAASIDKEVEEILSQGEMTEARRKEIESKVNDIWDKDSGQDESDAVEAEE